MRYNLIIKPEIIDETNIISISSSYGSPLFVSGRANVLPLVFDDISEEDFSWASGEKLVLFNDDHANSIIKFMEKIDRNKTLIVHCDYGISRSGAVGVWAQTMYGTDEEVSELFVKFPITPNYYIFDKLSVLSGIRDRKRSDCVYVFTQK